MGAETIYLDRDPQDGQEYDTQCARCGSSLEWRVCEFCGGDGVSGHDCGEDCCPCLYPEDNMPCVTCEGAGGWRVCLSRSAWCEANPLPGREGVPSGAAEFFALPPRNPSARARGEVARG